MNQAMAVDASGGSVINPSTVVDRNGASVMNQAMAVDRVEFAVVTMVNSGGWEMHFSRDDKNNVVIRKSA